MQTIELKVDNCAGKDADRGIARIDPSCFESLGIDVGSFIRITGKNEAAAKAMPSYIEDRNKGIIKIDLLTRENAGIGVNEKVMISKLDGVPAGKVFIVPSKSTGGNNIGKYLGKVFENRIVKAGDHIRANAFGFVNDEFLIEKTVPTGFVVINQNTVFSVHNKDVKALSHKISYEHIGGLEEQIRKIREMVELPLKCRELFERLGIEAPKGVLLYGPPGSGKTMIAKAVANETSAHFISINGPEIIQKFYGESEANLRKIFEEAHNNSPAIIFIDEIDAIAPKRGNVQGDVEKRVVTQLLTLMDGIRTKGQVIVIGATNMPELLDSALRRPGRFDREIYIGVPDKKGRLEILNVHSGAIPLSEDVQLEKLAEMTHGFVGADIANLCREAAMTALRKILPDIDMDMNTIPYEKIINLKVTMSHFLAALNQIEPSALREVFVDKPRVTWDEIGGYKSVIEELKDEIELPHLHPELFEKVGIKSGRGVLLSGPPGTGKTMMVKALANDTGLNFIYVKGPELMSKWIGDSEKGIREIFKKARLASPCIIFFDEVDSIAPRRGSGGTDSGVAERVISQMLTEMDGMEKRDGIVVVAATNREDILDEALLRPGRFDAIIRIKNPTTEESVEIFNIYTKHLPIVETVDPVALMNGMTQLTGANIANLCKKAGIIAVKRLLSDKREGNYDPEEIKIREEDFITALNRLR